MIKLLKENIREKLHRLGDYCLDMMPKNTGNKSKNKQMALHQTLKLCVSKDTINRQPTECEKIFANHISGKRITSRIYK